MITIKNPGAQGDILVRKVKTLPTEGLKVSSSNVVSHSETGHAHRVVGKVTVFEVEDDPFTCYLKAEGDDVRIEHSRDEHKHATHALMKGLYKIFRQREYTPEGFRRVQD